MTTATTAASVAGAGLGAISAERLHAFHQALAKMVARRVLAEIEAQKCDGPAAETGPVAEEQDRVRERDSNAGA